MMSLLGVILVAVAVLGLLTVLALSRMVEPIGGSGTFGRARGRLLTWC